jgi:hypothetical protein
MLFGRPATRIMNQIDFLCLTQAQAFCYSSTTGDYDREWTGSPPLTMHLHPSRPVLCPTAGRQSWWEGEQGGTGPPHTAMSRGRPLKCLSIPEANLAFQVHLSREEQSRTETRFRRAEGHLGIEHITQPLLGKTAACPLVSVSSVKWDSLQESGFWWWVTGLPFTSCVALAKASNLSEPY